MSNSPGNLIVLLDHGFDFRDYLDDKDIHSGDQLDLWHEGRWLAVRCKRLPANELLLLNRAFRTVTRAGLKHPR